MKKGLAVSMLALIILATALGLGLGKFAYDYTKALDKKKTIEVCHVSITFISQTRRFLEGKKISTADLAKVDCPVIEVTLPEKPEEAIAVLVQELTDCWYKTGKMNNRLGYAYGFFIDGELTHCTVCGEFTMKNTISASALQEHFTKRINSAIRTGDGKGTTRKKYLKTSAQNCEDGSCYFAPLTDKPVKYTALAQGTTYYIIASSNGKEVDRLGKTTNHLYITPAKGISTQPCNQLHYQSI